MNRILLAALVLACITVAGAHAETRLPLYTFYEEAPYALDGPNNRTAQLAAYLTRASKGEYRFEPVYVPRRRMDMLIQKPGWRGVMAWGNPHFFTNLPADRVRWTNSLWRDQDLIASLRTRPINFSGPQSLYGLRLGVILGWQLDDLEPFILSGQIKRDDAPNAIANLKKLRAGRIDVTLIQSTALPYFRENFPDLDNWLYISPTPRREIERQLGVDPSAVALYDFLQRAIKVMPAKLPTVP